MTNNLERARRPRAWIVFPTAVVLGLINAAFELSNHKPGDAVFALVLFVTFGVIMAWGKSEWVLAGSGGGDERQQRIGEEALKLSSFAVATVAVAGFLWTELRHGRYGPFGVVCSVGGLTYLLALVLLPRRR